jgi:integrase
MAGLRLMKSRRLRVQDVDFDHGQVFVRNGKGGKDRAAVLPTIVVAPLGAHLGAVFERHGVAIRERYAGVELPHAVAQGSGCEDGMALAVPVCGW